MTEFRHDNIDDIVENFDYPTPTERDSNIYALLGVLASENERLDLDIESLYDSRFLDSATGEELEKIAFEVGIRRNTGETDNHLRARTKATYGALSSDGTYEDVAAAAKNALGADADEISMKTPPQTPDKIIQLEIDSALFSNSPLTEAELADYLDDAVSADANVEIVITGTFAFAGSDSSLEGFNEGTWSSTVEE